MEVEDGGGGMEVEGWRWRDGGGGWRWRDGGGGIEVEGWRWRDGGGGMEVEVEGWRWREGVGILTVTRKSCTNSNILLVANCVVSLWTVEGGRDGVEGGRDGVEGGRDGVEGGRDGVEGGRDGVEGGRDVKGMVWGRAMRRTMEGRKQVCKVEVGGRGENSMDGCANDGGK